MQNDLCGRHRPDHGITHREIWMVLRFDATFAPREHRGIVLRLLRDNTPVEHVLQIDQARRFDALGIANAAVALDPPHPRGHHERRVAIDRPDDYTPNVRLRLEMGRYILAEDYARALRGREMLRHEVDAALGDRDGLDAGGAERSERQTVFRELST